MGSKIHTNSLKLRKKIKVQKYLLQKILSHMTQNFIDIWGKTIKRTTRRQNNDVNKAQQVVHDCKVIFLHNDCEKNI